MTRDTSYFIEALKEVVERNPLPIVMMTQYKRPPGTGHEPRRDDGIVFIDHIGLLAPEKEV